MEVDSFAAVEDVVRSTLGLELAYVRATTKFVPVKITRSQVSLSIIVVCAFQTKDLKCMVRGAVLVTKVVSREVIKSRKEVR